MKTAQIIPFKFEAREVRTLRIADQPWFCAADVCAALAIGNASLAVNGRADRKGDGLDEDEKGIATVNTPSGEQQMLVVNESGLYALIFKSRKKEAKNFQKWVTAEVLPAIRKHGSYTDTHNKMGTLIGETIGTNGFNMLGALIKGKVVRLPAANQRRATSKIWSQTHAAFGVRSAADIPASQLDAARNFIAAYTLDGEWLPAVEQGHQLDENSLHNLRALCHHTEWLLKNWNASLDPALRQVGSPLAAHFHDHFVSAAALGRSLAGAARLAG